MDLNVEFVGNATWVITVDDKIKIGCDPALAPKGTKYIYKGLKTSRVKAPVCTPSTFSDVKLWVLTHGHFDHFDKQGLAVIEKGASIISHKNCKKLLKSRPDLEMTYLKWNQVKTVQLETYQIEIKAIPAVHGMNLLAKLLMGGVNGYLIKISNNSQTKTIYVTSDTVYREEIKAALGHKKIDLLVANLGQAKEHMMGGPFTMNIEMLQQFIAVLKPGYTLPIHIDDFEHFGTSREAVKKLECDNLKVLENGESLKLF